MPTYTRVRLDGSGHEKSVPVVRDGMTQVKSDQRAQRGDRPMPPKHKTTVSKAAAKKAAESEPAKKAAASAQPSKEK